VDSLDYKIIEELSRKGRMTWAELAGILGLTSPSVIDRVKRLEEKKVILGYKAQVNHHMLGLHVIAFIAVTLEHPKYISKFLDAVGKLKEIEECHHVAGDDDYLLKVRCETNQTLDTFLNTKLKEIPGVSRTRTTIALSTSKEE
jgi:Lrp/AsnC family transcriptional regulator, leucine-responsive regulatory protein